MADAVPYDERPTPDRLESLSHTTLGSRSDDVLARYSRQVLIPELGEDGQRRLMKGRATLIGCGALGTVQAEVLVRAGVGFLRICDRDYIELDNLQRQVLFDETDLAAELPKAEAARRKLALINSQVSVDAVVTHVDHTNIDALVSDADVILDGTDNFETRYLINDWAVANGRPWIYGAVIGTTGLCMPIVPGRTPCLRCVFEDAPPPELNPTCDTVGVLGSVVNVVASLQATEAIKILAGRSDALNCSLTSVDVWSGRMSNLNVSRARESGTCPCCDRRDFEYLEGQALASTTVLCGRDAVQIGGGGRRVDFDSIAAKLRPVATGEIRCNVFMLKARLSDCELTLFADGRAIIKGTHDADHARSLYAKYIGA